MLLVGLTGNIASGKSEVARLLETRGATIIDADQLAREAVEPGTPGFRQIVSRWGDRVIAPDGTIDRAALRQIVFADRAQLNELNAIIHPEVATLRDAQIDQAVLRRDPIVVYAIPLLFEANMADEFDLIVLVDAPKAVRLDRLIHTRGLDATEALNMIRSQMPAELKRGQGRSDYVIENDGSLDDLQRQTDTVWSHIVAEARRRGHFPAEQ